MTIYESPYRIQRLVFLAGFCQGLHDFHGFCQDLHGFLGEGLHDFCGFCQQHNSKPLQLNVELNFIICYLHQSSTLKFIAMRRVGGGGGGREGLFHMFIPGGCVMYGCVMYGLGIAS